MVMVDPKLRWSAKECLDSAYFDDVRSKPLEKYSTSEVFLSVDKPDVFDYYECKNLKYNLI